MAVSVFVFVFGFGIGGVGGLVLLVWVCGSSDRVDQFDEGGNEVDFEFVEGVMVVTVVVLSRWRLEKCAEIRQSEL